MSSEVLDYLYGLKKFGSKLGLERMRQLVNALNCPYQRFSSVHVAGTNGKGSVCAFLSSILQESGYIGKLADNQTNITNFQYSSRSKKSHAHYKVGLYTSPHLVKFNERIQINGQAISDEELAELTAEIKEVVESNNIETTFFEFTTTLAFLYFARKEVDIAIIETGLGGRLDATNVVIPLVSVITNISLEHLNVLGDTKEKIAPEKAGIIKENIPVVTAERDEKVLSIFRDVCKEKNSDLSVLDDYQILESNLNYQEFKFNSKKYKIKLLGEHQVRNACTALLAAEKLSKVGFNISEEAMVSGLEKAHWPGRLEVVNEKPLTIVDCAHNVAGMEKLVDFVSKINKREILRQISGHSSLSRARNKKKILVVGFSEDKQIKEMVSLLDNLVDEVIITKSNFKPADLDLIEKYFSKKVIKKEKVEDALMEAKKMADEDDLILITGSIYLIGDVLKHRNLFK